MGKLRKILYPLSILYGEIVKMRNKAFDKGVISSTSFDIPVIAVGNLNVGGTGKTPQIEYLINLLKPAYKLAVLSRGYKRKTKGFVLATKNSTTADIGDEPLQFYSKFKEVIVAVDSDRVNGIKKLKQLETPPDIVLLDDAFQHRNVKPGYTVLLTAFNDLYVDDMVLPAGNLREKVEGAKRAQIIVVTKCPDILSEKEQFEMANKLQPELEQTIFFSKIEYNESVLNNKNTISIQKLKKYKVLLVTGIANPKPLLHFLKENNIDFTHFKFSDHHHFSKSELKNIYHKFDALNGDDKIILTTEKDYVRNFLLERKEVYYLPIRTKFIDHESDFNTLILNYVRKNTGNS